MYTKVCKFEIDIDESYKNYFLNGIIFWKTVLIHSHLFLRTITLSFSFQQKNRNLISVDSTPYWSKMEWSEYFLGPMLRRPVSISRGKNAEDEYRSLCKTKEDSRKVGGHMTGANLSWERNKQKTLILWNFLVSDFRNSRTLSDGGWWKCVPR